MSIDNKVAFSRVVKKIIDVAGEAAQFHEYEIFMSFISLLLEYMFQ
ncbi:hypothetical protein SPIROBIBN47_170011 [uncultured spirochete]|uniref:Uncharacterized protein n=1 Tax=uncultured spirochete TaxID=156406 RepID=A0A3P3XGL1_9SPIR|nr:hypothetical protein SPIROBIBN47_170011 [uncultured spirochete]